MMKRGIVLHDISHVLLPFLLTFIIVSTTPDVEIIKVLPVIFIGAFIPDIDHLTLKKHYKSINSFVRYCVVGNRNGYRKSFLFFHTLLTLLIILVAIPFAFLINFNFGIFLLAFFAHLLLDLLTDKLMIKKHGHWKIRSKI